MGKASSPRRVGDNEALAVGNSIRGSAQKLNLVAQLIRGKKAEDALNILSFSKKSMAKDVGKSITMKRWKARARGRSAKIIKPFSRVRIVVREHEEEEA